MCVEMRQDEERANGDYIDGGALSETLAHP